ncbi:MAG: HipA domain-containing protein [Lachnospiraceae bacterium]|nr:HipA domain-containing protein [Lachnospiraceae bacterium]
MEKDRHYTLMHKYIPVVEMELDEASGFVRKIGTVYAPEHLPVGVTCKNGRVDRSQLNDWWTERAIPASRSGVREALEKLEITSTKMLLVRCYGLSLSDQYWIRPTGTDLQWDAINFFQNDFSEDIGDVLFGADKKANLLDFLSPDNTSDGNLKKRWKILNGKRYLVKGGSNPFRQQPFNEVIAAGIMERLHIAHVPYRLIWNNGAPYSVCEDFVDEKTELIPAWRILGIRKRNNSTSVYQHFVENCAVPGIPDVVPFLDRMITLDYILANEDRHFNNFGALRDAETLEWIGMAPIYDSGSSLGYDKMPTQMRSEKEVVCKPFKNHHAEQLKLVSSFDWLELSGLADVGEFMTEVFSDERAAEYIDARRIAAIRDAVERRIGNLSRIVQSFSGQERLSTKDDVAENLAEEYGSK